MVGLRARQRRRRLKRRRESNVFDRSIITLERLTKMDDVNVLDYEANIPHVYITGRTFTEFGQRLVGGTRSSGGAVIKYDFPGDCFGYGRGGDSWRPYCFACVFPPSRWLDRPRFFGSRRRYIVRVFRSRFPPFRFDSSFARWKRPVMEVPTARIFRNVRVSSAGRSPSDFDDPREYRGRERSVASSIIPSFCGRRGRDAVLCTEILYPSPPGSIGQIITVPNEFHDEPRNFAAMIDRWRNSIRRLVERCSVNRRRHGSANIGARNFVFTPNRLYILFTR